MNTTNFANPQAQPGSNHNKPQELLSQGATLLPTPPDSQKDYIPPPSMKNLDDFIFLKKAPSSPGMLIWSFSEQVYVVWNPSHRAEHARELLWRGVLIIFKALYLDTHACSAEAIRKWAPDEFVHKAFTKEDWEAKIKINHSLFHSYVLKTAVTVKILKRWQGLHGYPAKLLGQSQNREGADKAKAKRIAWFKSQAESDTNAFFQFTRCCSEAVNLNLIYECNSTEADRSYNWIIYSLACAADIVFGLALDESGGGDSRMISKNRNQVWEAMVEKGSHYYKSFPLAAIFWPKPSSESECDVQRSEVSGKVWKAISTTPDSARSDGLSKRRRQPTQKAQELSNHATAKRPKRNINSTFNAEEIQQSSSEMTEPYGRTRAQPAAKSVSPDAYLASQGSRTHKTPSSDHREMSNSISEVPPSPSTVLLQPDLPHKPPADYGIPFKVPQSPTITIALVAGWDTEAAISHLRSMQVNEDDIVTISTQKYIGIDVNMVDEIELPFSGHILWYLHKTDIYDPNMHYKDPLRLWAVIMETRALARRQSRVLEKRALRALGEWEGDSDDEGEQAEEEQGFFPEGEEDDEITKDRRRVETRNAHAVEDSDEDVVRGPATRRESRSTGREKTHMVDDSDEDMGRGLASRPKAQSLGPGNSYAVNRAHEKSADVEEDLYGAA